ncbi:CLUMA_CG015654, isoform A [Clunio marinus]|uniref:CLUMA_CG015654, isoform A n=1 Tax=Clunio marinus TaxID=568069 RepID=A0A1J1IP66_9DIPT|nr:CLUMA_CG015654, isoform A [Clunio marinus]
MSKHHVEHHKTMNFTIIIIKLAVFVSTFVSVIRRKEPNGTSILQSPFHMKKGKNKTNEKDFNSSNVLAASEQQFIKRK